MQAGDLADGPLADILRTLAAAGATGGVHVQQRDAAPGAPRTTRDAVLFLRDGQLYAATSPGPRPLLGVRLVSAGAVTREALEEALESQAGELAGWRLGELLVHLGYVDAEIVTEFVIEQILDTVAEVSSWPAGSWRFRRGEKTREADDLFLDIEEVLERVSERLAHWSNLAAWGSKADAVPVRVSFDEELESAQMPLARTLLREVDGRRSLTELAARCGLTTFEAGQVLALLVDSGAVQVRGPESPVRAPSPEEPAAPAAVARESAPAGPPLEDDLAALLDAAGDDLGRQLAVLARQAADAQYAVEQRRHDELTTRRSGAPAEAEPIEIAPVAVEHIDVAPLEPGQHAVAAVVPPTTPEPEPELDDERLPETLAGHGSPAPYEALASGWEDAPSHQMLVEPLAGDPVDVVPGQVSGPTEPIDLHQPAGLGDVPADLSPSAADLDAWAAAVADLPDGETDPAADRAPDPAIGVDPEVAFDPAEPHPTSLVPPRPVGRPPGAPAPPPLAPVWPATEPVESESGIPLAPAAHAGADELVVSPFEPTTADHPVEVSAAAHFAELAEILAAPLAPDTAPDTSPDTSPDTADDMPAVLVEPAHQAAIRAALSQVELTDFVPAAPEPRVDAAAPEPAPLWGQRDDFTPTGDSPFADTASLLRELSSLGLDDAPVAATRTPTPRAASTAGAAKPKRKSIFGR